MDAHHLHWQKWMFAAVISLSCASRVTASEEPTLTKEQIKHFLRTAKVVKSERSKKGITNPWRLTLSDGVLTHDASFQDIDEHKPVIQLTKGAEIAFVDSYKYNIAAYELAEMLDLDDILPVYVERKWQGNEGSLSWWLPVKMDEVERHKQKLTPPDSDAWNNQMYKIRVFDQLVYDTDINLTNVLIGANWKIWRVDFTRAFRLHNDLQNSAEELIRCDRHLLEKLNSLDGNELSQTTSRYLTKSEIKALMTRRDKIVAYFQKLIAEKGENEVLY